MIVFLILLLQINLLFFPTYKKCSVGWKLPSVIGRVERLPRKSHHHENIINCRIWPHFKGI